MAVDVKELDKLRALLAKKNDARQRAAGALDRLQKQMQQEFECNSLEEAEQYRSKIKKKLEKASEKYDELKKAFDEEWGRELKHLDE